jgi:hypothetical protein
VWPGHVGVAALATPIGAIVGLIIGAVSGFVSGAYAIHARRHQARARVALGIRCRVVGVICTFVGIVACLATAAGADANAFIDVVGLPALTALVLGSLGSGRIAAAYLRQEIREEATV